MRMSKGREAEIASVSKGIVLSKPVMLGLLAPLFFLLGVFFVGTVVSLMWETLQGGIGATTELYQTVLSKSLFQKVTLRTLRISIVVTVATLVLGYATAYAIWRSSRRVRAVLVALVMFPLFTSVVVRTYAWTTLLNRWGLINVILLELGLIDSPLRLVKTEGAVLVGMIQVLLPFAILPIYTTLMRLDEDLLRASAIAGAKGHQTFRRVVLPLTMQGTVVAGVLVFVVSLGFFITPAILGGPQVSMLSNLISTEVTTFLDLRDGAAMSLSLLVVTVIILVGITRICSLTDHLKGEER